LIVSVDGVIQTAPSNYTLSGSTITFTGVPDSGANVVVKHIGFRTTSTVTALQASSVTATEIADGAITNAKIVSVANTKITGNIISSQITSVANTQITGNITSSQITSNPTFYGNVSVTGVTTLTGGLNAALPVLSGGTGVTTKTGTGAVVLGTSPTLATPTFDSAQLPTISGTAPLYMCRAWVNFNGTGTVAIRGSGNVSSITDNGVGFYTVNFTTAMPDANYTAVASTAIEGTYAASSACSSTTNTASGAVISVTDYNGPARCDQNGIYINIFR
jgi:hypothetical protein